jgi:predicted ArsR family transcriptional regulator
MIPTLELLQAVASGNAGRSSLAEVATQLGADMGAVSTRLDPLIAGGIVATVDDSNPAPGRERLYYVTVGRGLAELDRLRAP